MTAASDSGAPVTLAAEGPVARRQALSRASRWLLLGATLAGIGVLAVLAWDVISLGGPRLSWDFLTEQYSRRAERAGIHSAILGTAWLLATTVVIAIPVAVGTAVFMEEFAPRTGLAGRVAGLIRLNIQNLAGVPSIIYGILGLALFVRFMDLGPTILAGGLTLALMIIPMTIIASAEAIRQVPPSIRLGSLALGATRLQTVWHHTLPNAIPGIMTGVILAVARAIGETAALIMIGAAAFVTFDPEGINDRFTIVPIQIYGWTIAPQQAFRENAAAAIIVLMVAVVGLNLVAVLIRERFSRRF
jgi:phosphate transport system permease protein